MPFFLLLLLSLSAFAGPKLLALKNVNFDYVLPMGNGEAEKIMVATDLLPATFPFEVLRTDAAFEVTTPFIDYHWLKPFPFVHDIESLTTKNLNLKVGGTLHELSLEHFSVRPRKRNDYRASGLVGTCEGGSEQDLLVKLLEDCRTKMDLKIKKVDVPEDFILYKLIQDLEKREDMSEIPGDNLNFSSRDGKYALQVYLKYWIHAGLRSWGTFSYEDDFKTLVIKVDQIKFGYLSVTTLVMNRLREMNQNPNVVVQPPFIKINLGSLNESK